MRTDGLLIGRRGDLPAGQVGNPRRIRLRNNRQSVAIHLPPGPDMSLDQTDWLITALRERARRHGISLQQELAALLAAATADRAEAALPPIQLSTVRVGSTSTWSRA